MRNPPGGFWVYRSCKISEYSESVRQGFADIQDEYKLLYLSKDIQGTYLYSVLVESSIAPDFQSG